MKAIQAPAAQGHGGATGTGGGGSTGAGLILGAMGVVFGDIGTSPLYTLQECVGGPHGVPATTDNVLGVLSLIFWSLIMVVTVKYLAVLMRADNHGEGGIMALLALLPQGVRKAGGPAITVTALLVLAGAALLFGDGIITPAISVLSAMEGLEVATPRLTPAVIPLTCVILVVLFAIQSRGTGGIGRLFGPVMVVWFTVIGLLGGWHVARYPSVLAAVSPAFGARFFVAHGWRGFTLLGSVVLAVTGGEALYADMGHFGRRPIRIAWLAMILPCLVLCYFGQGALVLREPSLAAQPFFGMVPQGRATIALVAIAAPATVIASQALISGVFSLTHQAVQLGYFPRVHIRHTSGETEGQVYVPSLNWGLAVACLALVLAFQQSSRLASAFGLAVSGTMAITSVVFYQVTRKVWHWPLSRAVPLLLLFLSFDLPFLAANLLKFVDGGYIPLLVGAGFFAVMVTWRIGRVRLADYIAARAMPIEPFLASLDEWLVARIPGAAVFLWSRTGTAPPVLLHHARRLRVLHETVVLLTVETEHVPEVPEADRLTVTPLGRGFHAVIARYGYMERPDVPAALRTAVAREGLTVNLPDVTYYLGRETLLAGRGGAMGPWSEGFFAFLSRNARSATAYFNVPPDQVVELGTQIDL